MNNPRPPGPGLTPPRPLTHSHPEPSGVSRCSANTSSASTWLRLAPETSSVSNVPKKLGHESAGPGRRAQVIPWREKEARDTGTRATSAAEGRWRPGTTHICRVYSAFNCRQALSHSCLRAPRSILGGAPLSDSRPRSGNRVPSLLAPCLLFRDRLSFRATAAWAVWMQDDWQSETVPFLQVHTWERLDRSKKNLQGWGWAMRTHRERRWY